MMPSSSPPFNEQQQQQQQHSAPPWNFYNNNQQPGPHLQPNQQQHIPNDLMPSSQPPVNHYQQQQQQHNAPPWNFYNSNQQQQRSHPQQNQHVPNDVMPPSQPPPVKQQHSGPPFNFYNNNHVASPLVQQPVNFYHQMNKGSLVQQPQPINLYQINRGNFLKPYEPPHIDLPNTFEHPGVNCSQSIFRCSLTAVPQTQELLKKSRLPFGLVLHPFKDLKQLSVLQSSLIVRCRSCRTYINPFVSFSDQRTWRCNICGRRNDLPDEFHYDPATKSYGDVSRRPEIKNATVEFIAPSEYMVRAPQVPVYFYVLDISKHAVETGYLDSFCSRLIANIDYVPGDGRSLIGFMCVDSNLHFYNIQEGRTPKDLIVSDLDECFLPSYDGMLISLSKNKKAIIEFLQNLPNLCRSNRDTNCAFGAALKAAVNLVSEIGGRITVMQTILPNMGPAALSSREDPNLRSSKDINGLESATDFYKNLALEACSKQIAVDLFVLSSQFVDLATISEITKFTGGCIYFYPNFNSLRNPYELKRYEYDLNRYITRKIGFEAVLRVRCTKGLSLHSFHGNFFVRSTDLLNLPNVNPDTACGILIQMDENLHEQSTACFQSALLYTSSKGERRIRVHTLCLPIKKQLNDIFNGADAEAVVSLLSKMAVDRSITGSLSDAREAIVNACIDALAAFSQSQSTSLASGCLLAPESLRTFPLYVLGLLKHTAFTYGTSIKLDSRVFAMCSFKTLPLCYLMLQIYPSLYPLHTIENTAQDPPLLPLSYERIDRHGVYLMDTGDWLFLYVGQSVSEQFCSNVFGVPQFAAINEDMDVLPELQNDTSLAIRGFINRLTEKRPISSPLRILREDSSDRELFIRRLVDDRCESSFSYIEFLRHLQTELTPR